MAEEVFSVAYPSFRNLGGLNVQTKNDVKMIISSFLYFMKENKNNSNVMHAQIKVFPYKIIANNAHGQIGILKQDVIACFEELHKLFKNSCSKKSIDFNQFLNSLQDEEIVYKTENSIDAKVYNF